MSAADSPLALLGYPASASRALRGLGLVTVALPEGELGPTLEACQTLGFCGALVHSSLEVRVAQLAQSGKLQADPTAKRAGRVDAVAFAGGAHGTPHGTYAAADALTDALEASGYAARGASAVFLGLGADDLALALPLARAGFANVGLAADSAPEAERAARALPGGLRAFPVSRRDAALSSLTERADLLVLTGGSLPPGLAQPYHTLIDLTGTLPAHGTAATLLPLPDLPARRLARQLAHATGQRLQADELTALLPALT